MCFFMTLMTILIQVYPSASKSNKDTIDIIRDWTQILIACEAKIVEKKNQANFVLVLMSDLTESQVREFGDLVISTEYVIQCLRHQNILSRKAHPKFNSI